MARMTGAERIYAAMEGKSTDILPYVGFFISPEARMTFLGPAATTASWADAVLFDTQFFGNDWIQLPIPLPLPSTPGPFSEIFCDDTHCTVARAPLGAIWFWRKNPYFTKPVHLPVRTEEDLERLEPVDVNRAIPRIKAFQDHVKRFKDLGYFLNFDMPGVFESSWMLLRGLEESWIDVVANPAFYVKIARKSLKTILDLLTIAKDILPDVDGVFITDDLGIQESPYFHASAYREIIMPLHQEMTDYCHSLGLKVCFHSHGNINNILPDLVEVGFDVIEPFDQRDHMDLAEVRAQYGDTVTLKGGISYEMGTMSADELKSHLHDVVRKGGSRSFILSTAGGVPPEMSLANLNLFNREVRRIREDGV
ncbi:MAG: hypothetical protein GX977_01220 [Firmicutes bacterium]|nr:hypothetical protein [Bacillota bacterium]